MKAYPIIAFAFTIALVGCQPSADLTPTEPNLRALSEEEQQLSEATGKFVLDLFQQLYDPAKANQFFSPLSIHQALSMTMNGNEGEVLEEFVNVLRYEGLSLEQANSGSRDLRDFLLQVDPKVKLAIANAIWYKKQYQVQVPFRQTAQDYFGAEIAGLEMLDPQSVNIINDWIEKQTNHLIQDMLDYIPPDAVMYLVNAIYFKGDWQYQFDPQKTKKEPFHTAPGQSIQVDMMDLGNASTFSINSSNSFYYLEIPYSTGQYSMGVLYHPEGKIDQVASLLNWENLQAWRKNSMKSNLILKMPRFKLRQKMDNMKDDLIAMGLQRPFYFDPANFTKLFSNPTEELKISRVIHDAMIEVDEKGSEAAAATLVEVIEKTSSGPSEPWVLSLDKPFVFFIQEKHSGAILFLGKLGNPNQPE